ncbi:sensor histidine kinase [Cellulomonas wangsupingiae]|uniref:histidine kinase n=1 Tax=Cellulomonas wangsupingiae TaxID=2968085 RepID=A0ABY5K682_9CELL|nr:histidine kinase [Cellulomonas wangsupingiae]MCC2334280.1 histidine kinase [Cellulomonas wangsupingiae]MCM0641280.1 histidine kinase [Cellulomonas wangsupingiae]UUI65956.1 histidine kinase [Cellulomonas wangsupingiae]
MTSTATLHAPGRGRRAWALTWRVLLALVVGALGGLVMYGVSLEADPTMQTRASAGLWLVADVAGTLVCGTLYVLRRRAPLLLTGIIVALGSFAPFAGGFVLLAVVSLATRRRWAEIAPIGVLWVGAALVADRAFSTYVVTLEGPSPSQAAVVVVQLVFTALVIVTGMFIGGRRALVGSLREQAAIARREADARGDSARAAERNRIAREMHDVLAHRLSLVALHAGALEYRAGLEPEQVRETAAVVRENAHEALGELREVLGLLRDTSTADEQARPQPTFAQVGELVEGTRAAGSPVTFVLDHVGEDDLARLPVSTSRHLYRVVQETLTNARKHAPGAPVQVRLHGSPGERVGVEVTNPVPEQPPSAPLPTSGWGLTGLSERLRLTGGGLDVQRRPDGTFAVQAWLPWVAGTEGHA